VKGFYGEFDRNPFIEFFFKRFMTIPQFQKTMSPFLRFISDEKEHHLTEVLEYISDYFDLTEEERREKLPSGADVIIRNRVAWTRTYFKKAGLLEYPKRGYVKITKRGLEVLEKYGNEVNNKVLMQFKEFIEFHTPKKKEDEEILSESVDVESETPEETIDRLYSLEEKNLAKELLENLRIVSPNYFEIIVRDLLDKMGYGDVEVTGGPWDGGMDGVVSQDKLGVLDKIYFQAKRYRESNLVMPNEVSKFLGDMDRRQATRGIFITTSEFHHHAKNIPNETQKTLRLIDGEEMAKLMIDYKLGVSEGKEYKFRRKVDTDYFDE